MSQAIVCGDSEQKNCPACAGTGEWGPQYGERPVDCQLCEGTGNIGLFAGFFQALDRAKPPTEEAIVCGCGKTVEEH